MLTINLIGEASKASQTRRWWKCTACGVVYYAKHGESVRNRSKAARDALRSCDPEGYQDHLSKQRESYRKRRSDNPVRHRLLTIKAQSKARGIPFDLDVSDIQEATVCPVLGISLSWGTTRTEATAEVDRLVPELGYVRGNVSVISRRANRLKNDGTPEEHELIARWMRSRGV